MLFYYFNSKKDLYLYLIEYCIKTIEEKYLNLIDTSEPDFFNRLKGVATFKLEFLRKYPDAMNFMTNVFLKNNDLLNDELRNRLEDLQKISYAKIYDHIDHSLFRSDMDATKASNIIRWAFDGFQEDVKYQLRSQDTIFIEYDPYWEQFYGYLDIMRKAFYKEGNE